MDGLHRDIGAFLRRAGIARGEPLLVAASGGADSTALLCALCAMGLRVGAAHVHHGLRGTDAEADAGFVAALAARLGVRVQIARVDASQRDGRSPEARARALRYAALEQLRCAGGHAWLVTAHTLDDQAETVLLRALRGSSLLGLGGIAPLDARRRLLRPLLGQRREALRAYLRARGEPWREDATNADLGLPRNRLRAEVLPALARVQSDAALKLARLADETRSWAAPRRATALERLGRALEPGEGGEWLALAALEHGGAAERRALLAAWLIERAGLARVGREHVERAAELAEVGSTGRALSLPGELALFRDRDALWLGPAPGPRFPETFACWLEPPAELHCPERDLRFAWQRAAPSGIRRPGWRLPAGTRVRVRSPDAGDRIEAEPGHPARALRELFSRAHWSRRRRARALVVEHDGRVVWVPGLARAGPLRASPADEARGAWTLVAGPLSTPGDTC
jgi:tRNA(Ile)-lysidine synthase